MREESHGQVDDHHVEESIDGNEKFHDENENDDNMENEQEEEDSQGEGVVHVDENSDAKQENSLSGMYNQLHVFFSFMCSKTH